MTGTLLLLFLASGCSALVYQYSEDVFRVCHSRLAPGGLMLQWLPLFRLSEQHLRIVMNSFLRLFRGTTVWYDGTSVLLVGSRDRPLATDAARVRKRLQQPRVRESLASIGAPLPESLRRQRLLMADLPEARIGVLLHGPERMQQEARALIDRHGITAQKWDVLWVFLP